ncbi:MAG: DUF1552 domain-containing protein, partial [Verrucomicrobiota bacterium]
MSNFQSKSWLISRRRALRGLGVSLALPMLDCMRAADGSGDRPRRSVFMYLPNGVNTIDYQIQQSGADYQMSKILQPLEKHRGVITPISGLHHPNGLGHHHNCQRIFLTAGKVGTTERNTISVDQLMAQQTAEHTRHSSIELSNAGRSLAWSGDGIQLPSERNPGVVFKRLFQIPEGGIDKQRRQLHRKGSILDAALEDAKS